MLRSIGRQRSRSMTRRNTIFTPSRSYLYDISITGSLVKMEVNTKHWESHFSKGFSTGLYRSTRTSTSKHPAFEDGCSSARKIVAVNTPTDKRSIISCAFWKGPCVYYPALEKKKKNPKKRVSNVFSLTLDPLFQLLHTSRTTSLARTEGIAHNNTSSDHREGKDSISSTASFLLVSVVWTLSHNPNTRYPQRLQS